MNWRALYSAWMWLAYSLFWFYYLPKEWAKWCDEELEQDEDGVWKLKEEVK